MRDTSAADGRIPGCRSQSQQFSDQTKTKTGRRWCGDKPFRFVQPRIIFQSKVWDRWLARFSDNW